MITFGWHHCDACLHVLVWVMLCEQDGYLLLLTASMWIPVHLQVYHYPFMWTFYYSGGHPGHKESSKVIQAANLTSAMAKVSTSFEPFPSTIYLVVHNKVHVDFVIVVAVWYFASTTLILPRLGRGYGSVTYTCISARQAFIRGRCLFEKIQ